MRGGDRGRVSVLFAILANVDSTGRVHAAESLFKVGQIDDGKLLRTAFAQTDNLQLRLMAAAALAKAGQADALQFLREQLRSEDRTARNSAAFALARVGTAADVAPLSQALESETDAVARAMLVCASRSWATPADAKIWPATSNRPTPPCGPMQPSASVIAAPSSFATNSCRCSTTRRLTRACGPRSRCSCCRNLRPNGEPR